MTNWSAAATQQFLTPSKRRLLTLLVPQSRFGDKLLEVLSGLSPKRYCSSKRYYSISAINISIKY